MLPCIGTVIAVLAGGYVALKVLSWLVEAWPSSTGRPAAPASPPQSAGRGVPPVPECRLMQRRMEKSGAPIFEVQFRGPFPVRKAARVAAVTHVFDADTGLPLICAFSQFQEPDSAVFRFKSELGQLLPDHGVAEWSQVGAVFPQIMRGPAGGRRRLDIVLRFIDLDNPPRIRHGIAPEHPGLLWVGNVMTISHDFVGRGYQELDEEHADALAAAIRVAVCMAMADRKLHRNEGDAIKSWMQKAVDAQGSSSQQALKQRLNSALRQAFAEASAQTLRLDDALQDLDDIDDSGIKYQVLQLAFDVLSADGSVASAELKIIDRIATVLDLDMKEVERIRDQALVGLKSPTASGARPDELLGIKPGWDRDAIHKHLRAEFQKWNGRLNTLPEGTERQNAQRMLDMIAEARKRHA